MSEPLRVMIDPAVLDAALAVLLEAITPKVAFTGDLEAMRAEAEVERTFKTKTAIALIYSQISGLQDVPILHKIVDEIGSATIIEALKR